MSKHKSRGRRAGRTLKGSGKPKRERTKYYIGGGRF